MNIDDYLSVFGQSESLGVVQVFTALLLSFLLSAVFANVYRWTFHGFSYSRSFVHTMVLGSMIVCMMIMAIGNNLARGLGILGTLAIIRFRTHVRDPRDMIFLFACFGIGIACGANVFAVAFAGTVTVSAAALLLHWSPFASRRHYEGLLRFCLDPKTGSDDQVQNTMKKYCSLIHLIAMREAAQGDRLEYSYQVRLLDPSYQKDLVEDFEQLPGVTEASLLMQRTTVEL